MSDEQFWGLCWTAWSAPIDLRARLEGTREAWRKEKLKHAASTPARAAVWSFLSFAREVFALSFAGYYLAEGVVNLDDTQRAATLITTAILSLTSLPFQRALDPDDAMYCEDMLFVLYIKDTVTAYPGIERDALASVMGAVSAGAALIAFLPGLFVVIQDSTTLSTHLSTLVISGLQLAHGSLAAMYYLIKITFKSEERITAIAKTTCYLLLAPAFLVVLIPYLSLNFPLTLIMFPHKMIMVWILLVASIWFGLTGPCRSDDADHGDVEAYGKGVMVSPSD